jgi:type 1 glutamine amidotransferase
MKMKTLNFALAVLVILFSWNSLWAADSSKGSAEKIRVLVITGGHDFEKEPFFKLFRDNPEITYRAVEHPNAHALLKAEAAKDYDVLVCYDMHQEITDEAKADFMARLKEGKGLVVLHHAIANYQQWPEYAKIIGARYYLEKTVLDGVEKQRSTYKHDMQFTIHVVDAQHPVTSGVKDFEIHDETYNLFDVAAGNHVLLTTDEQESNKIIGWTKTYGEARVVYLQSGHDHFAYENPNYCRILRQAIHWTARRP